MTHKLAKSALSVQNELNKLNLKCEVVELPNSTRTASAAALSIGCEISQIVKSLIFKTKKTSKAVLLLASGKNQVDVKQVKTHLGEGITKADADFVKNITGFSIGGIPPVGLKNKIDLIFIDQDLIEFEEVWAAAGTPNAVFCIKSQDLLQATGGKVICISCNHSDLI